MAADGKITARAVTLNFKFKEWELKHAIEDAGMTTAVFNQDITDRMVNLRPELPGVRNYIIIGERHVEGMYNYHELVKDKPAIRPRPLGGFPGRGDHGPHVHRWDHRIPQRGDLHP